MPRAQRKKAKIIKAVRISSVVVTPAVMSGVVASLASLPPRVAQAFPGEGIPRAPANALSTRACAVSPDCNAPISPPDVLVTPQMRHPVRDVELHGASPLSKQMDVMVRAPGSVLGGPNDSAGIQAAVRRCSSTFRRRNTFPGSGRVSSCFTGCNSLTV